MPCTQTAAFVLHHWKIFEWKLCKVCVCVCVCFVFNFVVTALCRAGNFRGVTRLDSDSKALGGTVNLEYAIKFQYIYLLSRIKLLIFLEKSIFFNPKSQQNSAIDIIFYKKRHRAAEVPLKRAYPLITGKSFFSLASFLSKVFLSTFVIELFLFLYYEVRSRPSRIRVLPKLSYGARPTTPHSYTK